MIFSAAAPSRFDGWPPHSDREIYDLEPIRLNYLNDKLRLDVAEANRNSPVRHLPSSAAPLVVTVGLGELPELIRQSEDFAEAWRRRGLPGSYLPVEAHGAPALRAREILH